MAKPKAPAWLREAFRDGVDDYAAERLRPGGGLPAAAYEGAHPLCWLAQHDLRRQPCGPLPRGGPLERFHFIPRQRVGNALYGLWRFATIDCPGGGITSEPIDLGWLIKLAEWDSRNGGLACEAHHRRFDNHLTPALPVLITALPERVVEFAADWGLEPALADRFPFP